MFVTTSLRVTQIVDVAIVKNESRIKILIVINRITRVEHNSIHHSDLVPTLIAVLDRIAITQSPH